MHIPTYFNTSVYDCMMLGNNAVIMHCYNNIVEIWMIYSDINLV